MDDGIESWRPPEPGASDAGETRAHDESSETRKHDESSETRAHDESGKTRRHDESEITGPSLGPHTVIEREPVEERLARHEQSEVDAMGKDKRRAVVGQSYGPSKARQLTLYGIFLAVVAALVVGGIILIGTLDTSVKKVPCSAPWCKGHPTQIQPKPIQ